MADEITEILNIVPETPVAPVEPEPVFDSEGWLITDETPEETPVAKEGEAEEVAPDETPEEVPVEETPVTAVAETPVAPTRSVGLEAYGQAVAPILSQQLHNPEPFREFDPEVDDLVDYNREHAQYEREANRVIARNEQVNFQNAQTVINHTVSRVETVAPFLKNEVQKMLSDMGPGVYADPLTALESITKAIGAAVLAMDETKAVKKVVSAPVATRQTDRPRGVQKDTSKEDAEFALIQQITPGLTREEYNKL